LKNFPGLYPRTPVKGEGRKGRTEGERRGLGTQVGRRGVVWDREREEGMRIIQRKGMGREEKGRGRRKEERDDLAPQQNSWIRH
jgi:hypothetical protein